MLMKKYKELMKKLNNYFNDFNLKEFNFDFPIKINDKFLNSNTIKITQKVYDELLKLTLQYYLKINWLKEEYKLKVKELKEKIQHLEETKKLIFENKNEILDNIIESNSLINSNLKPLEYSFLLKNNFVVKDDYLIPLLYNFEELNFEKQIMSNKKIILNTGKKKIISSLELNFNVNINSEIIICYKEELNSKIKYTSEKIKLSKNKLISLNFQDCAQIIIFSNSDFVEYLTDIKLKGANSEADKISLKGLIELKEKKERILINSKTNFTFYQVLDNDELKPIENNLINKIETNKMQFELNTNDSVLDKFKIFGLE